MQTCPECDTVYSSALAAAECADLDRADAKRQRAWTDTHEIVYGIARMRSE